jgi:hypothetical protein
MGLVPLRLATLAFRTGSNIVLYILFYTLLEVLSADELKGSIYSKVPYYLLIVVHPNYLYLYCSFNRDVNSTTVS